ncbi:hypothetical protein [Nostoc sp. PCC 7107]|uniref:hypothetical protein n=1 Tax=Nostoc sp. PCC 7107 TaxID=317936 RepID=UPI00031C2BD7|nr:hypothetical protein [Nostoc sp. PCC 7107]
MNQNFQLVPENPETFNVNMPFLLFRTPNRPNIQVDNPQQNILYRVENNNGNLVVEEYPIENN